MSTTTDTTASGAETASVSAESSLPLLKSEKRWGPLAIFGNTASAAVATWCFITGGFVAYYLPAGKGAIAITAGTLIGVFIALLAALPASTRYGIEAVRSTRPMLGARGSNVTVVLILLILIGWNSVLTIALGSAAAQALVTMGLIDAGAVPVVQVIFVIIGLIVVWILLRHGTAALRWAGPVVAITVLLLATAIAVILLVEFGWDRIAQAVALGPLESANANYMIVTELGVAGAVAWWPYVGSLTRNARTTKAAILPSILGLGAMMSAVLVIGLLAALVVPESGGDPTEFMIGIGGPVFGVIALIFMIFANIGTTMVGTYAAALGLKQVPSIDRRVSWRWSVVIVLVPVLIVSTFFAEVFMANYGTFLAFAGVTLGPMCGMQIVDYYFLRKQELDVRGLYSVDGRGAYWYYGGFNPAGFIAITAGVVAYFIVLDPVTFTPGLGFEFLTATVPATIVSGLVYFALARLFPAVWRSRTPR